MKSPDTLTRFVAAVELALVLPHPTDIYRAILTGTIDVDDGLRGTAYDGDRTSGGGQTSSVERMLERKHPGQFPKDDDDQPGKWGARTDRSKDDLLHLRRATDRVLDSIAALNAECCAAGQPDDWDDALKCAHLLHETGMLQAAIDLGRDVDSWALRFCHAIDTVRAIRDSWMAHEAPDDIAEQNFVWCQSHARLNLKEKRTSRRLCTWCWRHVQDLAEFSDHPAVVLQEQDDNWPSVEMIRAKQDQRRVLYDKEHALWLRAHGIDPTAAHQRRQHRRTA